VKQCGYPSTVRSGRRAYWDQETIRAAQKDWPQPVYNDKAATDANETITQVLLENHEYLYQLLAVMSDRKLIQPKTLIPRRRFEMQVLHGMGDKLAKSFWLKGVIGAVYVLWRTAARDGLPDSPVAPENTAITFLLKS